MAGTQAECQALEDLQERKTNDDGTLLVHENKAGRVKRLFVDTGFGWLLAIWTNGKTHLIGRLDISIVAGRTTGGCGCVSKAGLPVELGE